MIWRLIIDLIPVANFALLVCTFYVLERFSIIRHIDIDAIKGDLERIEQGIHELKVICKRKGEKS
jgi:hypothetical protein